MKLLVCAMLAHLWYPPECCTEEHCRPVPCDQITKAGGDFVYDGMIFSGEQVRPSLDAQCHACFSEGKIPYCLFLTPFS